MAGGGGLIQLPALFAAYPATPHPTLLGTGKLAGFAGTTSAAARFVRHVRLDWKLVLPAAAGAVVAALVGAWIATRIPSVRFRALVPVLLAFVLAYTLLHRDFGREHRPRRQDRHGSALAAAGAGVIGLYDGFFGPGTGSFLVFLFVRVFGLDFLHASASAKLVNAAANLAAILMFGLTGELFWLLGIAMAACNVAGAQLGSHLAIRHGSGFVRAVFIAVVSCLIAKTAWDALQLHF
ncbi:MAG: sulfite exporter TauE/SafE family protein [Gammaproteobacteria bacterium]|nr:sulfite exporter TauE/SafE family protein [Gammaproteobacteria bacterium]